MAERNTYYFPYFTVEEIEDWWVNHLPPDTCFSGLQTFMWLFSCRILSETEMFSVSGKKIEPENSLPSLASCPVLMITDAISEVGCSLLCQWPGRPCRWSSEGKLFASSFLHGLGIWWQLQRWDLPLQDTWSCFGGRNTDPEGDLTQRSRLMGSAPCSPQLQSCFLPIWCPGGHSRVCRRALVLVILAHKEAERNQCF